MWRLTSQEWKGCGHSSLEFLNIDIDSDNNDLYWELWKCTFCGASHSIPYTINPLERDSNG